MIRLLALLLMTTSASAEPHKMNLTQGIVCKTQAQIEHAFDWASEHPTAAFVDLTENPGCVFIVSPIVAVINESHVYENKVARVLIGTATPRNGDTRFIWMKVRMLDPGA